MYGLWQDDCLGMASMAAGGGEGQRIDTGTRSTTAAYASPAVPVAATAAVTAVTAVTRVCTEAFGRLPSRARERQESRRGLRARAPASSLVTMVIVADARVAARAHRPVERLARPDQHPGDCARWHISTAQQQVGGQSENIGMTMTNTTKQNDAQRHDVPTQFQASPTPGIWTSAHRSVAPTSRPPTSRSSPGIPTASPAHVSARLLLIDDDPALWRAMRLRLAHAGFALRCARTATQGLEHMTRWHPDAVLLDLTLPDMDGLEACRRIRAWSQVPIIVLSMRASDADKIMAFEAGVDDYLTKPYSLAELVARIRVALRHVAQQSGRARGVRFQTHGLTIDFEKRLVSVQGAEVRLTPTEYAVLTYLAVHVGKVVTHRSLLQGVWGSAYEDAVHSLHVCISQLRRKLEREAARPGFVLTEPGIGYRLRSAE